MRAKSGARTNVRFGVSKSVVRLLGIFRCGSQKAVFSQIVHTCVTLLSRAVGKIIALVSPPHLRPRQEYVTILGP